MSKILSFNEITKFKTVKMSRNNYWLLELIYGNCAYDKTAKFQLPNNVKLKTLK